MRRLIIAVAVLALAGSTVACSEAGEDGEDEVAEAGEESEDEDE